MSWKLLPLAFALLGLTLVSGIWLTALGRRLKKGFVAVPSGNDPALDCALGLATFGQLMFVLGIGARLTPWPIAALVLTLTVISHRELFEIARGGPRVVERGASRLRESRWLLLAYLAVGAPLLVLALYPPTGFDSLNYHLPFTAAFAESGRLVIVDTLRFEVFPQLVELVMVVPFLLLGAEAAVACLLVPTLAVATLVARWASLRAGRSSAHVAAAIWLGGPLVVWLSSQAYVDHTLTLFVVAGLFCIDRYRTQRAPGWLALSGWLLGAACATKYLGLPWAGMGLLSAAAVATPSRRVRLVAIFALSAALGAAPWYIRIAAETGNPVYPVFDELFASGDRGHTSGHPAREPTSTSATGPRPLTARLNSGSLGVVILPFTATWIRGLFDFQAPASPWTLPLLIGSFWVARRCRFARWLVLLVLGYGLSLLTAFRLDPRFLLPVTGLLAVTGAVAIRPLWATTLLELPATWRRRMGRRRLETLLFVLLVGFGPAYGIYKVIEHGPPPTSDHERIRYLRTWIPGYDAVISLNDAHGGDYTAFGLELEKARYFAHGRYLGDYHGRYRYRDVAHRLANPSQLEVLLDSWGVDYLILPAGRALPEGTPCFQLVRTQDGVSTYRLTGTGERDCQ